MNEKTARADKSTDPIMPMSGTGVHLVLIIDGNQHSVSFKDSDCAAVASRARHHEAVTGVLAAGMPYPKPTCPSCRGRGISHQPGRQGFTCDECHGSGAISADDASAAARRILQVGKAVAPICHGCHDGYRHQSCPAHGWATTPADDAAVEALRTAWETYDASGYHTSDGINPNPSKDAWHHACDVYAPGVLRVVAALRAEVERGERLTLELTRELADTRCLFAQLERVRDEVCEHRDQLRQRVELLRSRLTVTENNAQIEINRLKGIISAGVIIGGDEVEAKLRRVAAGESPFAVFHQAPIMQEALAAHFSTVDARRPAFDLVAHLRRQQAFSERTFGPGQRTAGVLDHLRKELREIEADPADVSEWIDVVLLALDGAWRHGFTPEQIAAALEAKQTKNEARQWPDWRTAAEGKAIEHQRQPIVAGVEAGG